MSEIAAPARVRSGATTAALLGASLVSLTAGSLLAVDRHGVLRALFGGGGFAAYVFFFGRALARLGFASSGTS
jgi:hypothetical protein